MKPLLAFHNDPKIKAKYLRRVRAHKKADEIINGQYWEDGMGCAVGCTIHSSDHAAYETQLGIPMVLARLEDKLFEAVYLFDSARAKEWPELFLSSIRVGSNLELVWPKFAHWLLINEEHGVFRHAKKEKTRAAIYAVSELYLRWMNGDKPAAQEWRSAADAAYAAAVAYAAAAAAAAADAAYAAAAAAAAATYAAAAAAYAAYARNEHYRLMADKLIQLLRESK